MIHHAYQNLDELMSNETIQSKTYYEYVFCVELFFWCCWQQHLKDFVNMYGL